MLLRLFSLLLAILLLNGPAHAQQMAPFELASGPLPPFAIENQADAPGALVEIAELLAQRLQQPCKTRFFPWARAIALPLAQTRIAVLPLTRTPEREKNYVWLAKLYQQRYVLISPVGKQPVKNLEQLKKQRIAVLRGSPTHLHLLARKIDPTNIMVESNNEKMFKALDLGLVDVVYGSEQINTVVIPNSGRQLKNYHFGMMLEQGEIWLGGSKDFSATDAAAFAQAMENLRKDGSYARLLAKYGLPS